MKYSPLLVGAGLMLSSCGEAGSDAGDTGETAVEPSAVAQPFSADLLAPAATSVGTVSVREDANGITVTVEAAGLEPGMHAVHLHETGVCEGPEFASAGGHWNPSGAQHGRDNPMGSHLGDLANMEIDEGGTGRSDYLVREATISGEAPTLADQDGTALVVHAGADDYRTDPSGAAGARVACAVLAAPRQPAD
ncbi:superoxide dismutase family protein [Sphingomicrobium astaxanthinifaciens]|uniref:superoxide dismutase family protein n=1 Tax=Sphingomicrobium astaxanthinifaciens TaxID=1227949 RepID=UPI001FCC13EC|nr:superoxide dismutase family protein [Sphingomicrobium astaxanthinifaciens]MCJ7420615.1 superoxide dismutase family protein [Sphingomicrobium astaxanthinifaciens]